MVMMHIQNNAFPSAKVSLGVLENVTYVRNFTDWKSIVGRILGIEVSDDDFNTNIRQLFSFAVFYFQSRTECAASEHETLQDLNTHFGANSIIWTLSKDKPEQMVPEKSSILRNLWLKRHNLISRVINLNLQLIHRLVSTT